MKLRRLMQKPPVEMKPTKGQRCASQQKLAADVADGSNATDRHARDARRMSAMPPIASVHWHRSGTPLNVAAQCSESA
jgi:hypothetical protein